MAGSAPKPGQRGYQTRYTPDDYRNALRNHATDGRLGAATYEQEHDRKTEPSLPRILQVYGRWNDAIRDAGLTPVEGDQATNDWNAAHRFPEAVCRFMLRTCALDLDQETISFANFTEWRARRVAEGFRIPSTATIRTRIGPKWADAVASAGMTPLKSGGGQTDPRWKPRQHRENENPSAKIVDQPDQGS